MASPFNIVLVPLFHYVAPDFDPTFMLKVLPKEFPALDAKTLTRQTAEFLKFIFLCSMREQHSLFVPVKEAIDEIWHIFILQTPEYATFCQALPGKTFIHHTTMHLDEFAENHDKSDLIRDMLTWIPQYRKHFGPFTEDVADYWLMPSFLRETLGISLADVNAIA